MKKSLAFEMKIPWSKNMIALFLRKKIDVNGSFHLSKWIQCVVKTAIA
jgi:hypothetical protein